MYNIFFQLYILFFFSHFFFPFFRIYTHFFHYTISSSIFFLPLLLFYRVFRVCNIVVRRTVFSLSLSLSSWGLEGGTKSGDERCKSKVRLGMHWAKMDDGDIVGRSGDVAINGECE